MFFKNISTVVFAFTLVSSCSFYEAFADNSKSNEKIEKSQKKSGDEGDISSMIPEAKEKVKKFVPEFIDFVSRGAKKDDIKKIFNDSFDTGFISKGLCGIESPEVINNVGDYLGWQSETESVKSVIGGKLGPDMRAVAKGKRISVHCKLSIPGKDSVEVIAVFHRRTGDHLKIVEVIVVGIPLINRIKVIIKKYAENNGKKMNSLSPAERVKLIDAAIKEAITKGISLDSAPAQ